MRLSHSVMRMAFDGYRAEQAGDGTWTIFGVPVFAAHIDDRDPENIVEFGAPWVFGAVSRAKTREAEGYLPPVHVYHHGTGKEVEGAGKFALRYVAPIMHGGEQILAAFADLVGVRPSIYDRIRRGELSYRSVEILDVETPELDSLALLDDEVPFFRLPLLKIASETASDAKTFATAGAARAFRAAGKGRAVLFAFEPEKDPVQKPEENKTMDPELAKKMLEMLTKIASAMGIDENPEENPDGADAQPKDTPAAAMSVGLPESNTTITTSPASDLKAEGAQLALAEQLAAMKSEIAAMKAASEIDAEASKLTAKGFSADAVAKFRSVASEHGATAARQFAAGLATYMPAEPPEKWTGELPVDAPEVAVYGQSGAAKLEQARAIASTHERLGSTVPLKDYIAANMNPDAYLGIGA